MTMVYTFTIHLDAMNNFKILISQAFIQVLEYLRLPNFVLYCKGAFFVDNQNFTLSKKDVLFSFF